MRSSARKSGSASPVSASTTAASETPGKWWPLATIWVPTRTARSAAAKRSSASRSAPGFAGSVGVKADPLELRHPLGELGFELLRPGADPRQLDEPHSGQASGTASE